MTPEVLFLHHLPLIDRIIQAVCRRHACYGAEAEDFASAVRVKLIDDDYAVLRQFGGKSQLSTYLMTVVVNLFRDHIIHKRGKWRPSTAAKQSGTAAVALETLVYRQGFSVDEAVEKIHRHDPDPPSRQELYTLFDKLPPRTGPRRFEGDDSLERRPSDERADHHALAHEYAEARERAVAILDEARAELGAEERLVLRLRFDEGLTARRIAEKIGLEQRAVFSLIDRLRAELRAKLEAQGVSKAVLAAFEWEEAE